MKTIALVSGGKDSILAVLMAYRHGHEPVVLVNMVPVLEGADVPPEACAHGHDIDSYMYQTVGYEAVEAMAACLGVPLRRGCVRRGRARDQSMLYSEQPPAEDEVETLHDLLRGVCAEFPEAQGLTSGAILSNYQRHRVERLCDRLGLESLAYLWMREAGEVLDMAHALRVRAVLVKTASIGLVPQQMLGKTLEQARPTLERLAGLYQSHLAGEGGEYETTVLDCPFFRETRLAVTALEVVMQDDNDIAPSGHGVLTVVREPKPPGQQAQDAELLTRLRGGEVAFPSDVMPLLQRLASSSPLPGAPTPAVSVPALRAAAGRSWLLGGCEETAARDGVEHHTYSAAPDASVSVAAAMDACMSALLAWASERHLTIFYLHVSLPDASWEAACRASYAASVSHVCPPGLLVTACASADALATPLQAEVLAVSTEAIGQRVLHAQSRSYWALGEPGPYAQARHLCLPSGGARLFVSATPGRVPATREVATAADLPAACESQVAAFAATERERDAAAQVLFALANCERYLALFQRRLSDVCRATAVVTADVSVALLAQCWKWATTQDSAAPPFEHVCPVVVVVGSLTGAERVRVSVECVEAAEGESDVEADAKA
ncbi:ATP-binding region containing protein [Novymonas esmeraldas]|uniref:Diphthine--ammonia ligase n=1 Tax=Novymonas esmeraldas TaxID=1808958 RepID=A0AAW0F5H0_9TRYP